MKPSFTALCAAPIIFLSAPRASGEAASAQPTMQKSPVVSPYNTEPSVEVPLPPQEAAARWKFPPGFTVTPFAAEPDVRQPIAMAMDHRGRLWVAECYTYAEHATGFATDLKDRILIFEDSDNDGKFDKRTVFCDGLDKLSSIEIGFGGVWALTLPEMIFIPDRNGDDIPDGAAEVKLDGFEWKVNHHTMPNGLRWGPDGWLYGRHGIQANSLVGKPGTPESGRTHMNVGIWRYHPQRGTFEVVCEGTTNPWGMDWNEVGEAFFINTVIGHLWHVIPGAHYRRMYGTDANPHLYELIEQHADHVHWAAGEAWNDWQKLGTTDATSAAGGGHAHTGLMFYGGDNWPDEWRGKLLTINFNGRRLNVENVVPDGSGYVGKHLPDTGFSADPFFRGIDLIYGPDGGVFLSDWSDAGECHDDSGVHRLSGRIFKITHGQPRHSNIHDIGSLSASDLLALLDAKNEFMARHARQRLQEMAVSGADTDEIRTALFQRFSESSDVVGKLRALWSLHAIGADDKPFLRAQLSHSEPMVRIWAIRLLLDDKSTVGRDIETLAALKTLAETEPAKNVRLALASALQRIPATARAAMAAPLLARAEAAADHNLPQMLWYGIEALGDSDPVALAGLAKVGRIPLVRRCIARRLMENATDAEAMVVLLKDVQSRKSAWQIDILDGLDAALKGRREAKPPGGWTEAAKVFAASDDPAVRKQFRNLGTRFGDPLALDATRELVLDGSVSANDRQQALRSLIDVRAPGLHDLGVRVLSDPALTPVASAALALDADPASAKLILKQYSATGMADRRALLDALLCRPEWASLVLDAISVGTFPREDLSAFHARQIRQFNDVALTGKLTTIWGEVRESTTDKKEKIARLQKSLSSDVLKQADLARGRTLFANICGACHHLNGEGGRIGPELTGSNRDNLDYLLQNVIDPGSVVAKGWQLTILTLKDGRTLSGFIRSENDQGVTLQTVTESITLPLADIASRETAAVSLMPDGLLDPLSESQVRDLIAYLMKK